MLSARIDVGAFGQQQFDHRLVAALGGHAQRRLEPGVWAGAIDIRAIGQQQFGGGDVSAFHRGLQRSRCANAWRVDQVRAVADHFLDLAHFLVLGGGGGGGDTANCGGRRRFCRQILAAQAGQICLVGKVAQDALVLRIRFVGPAQFAQAFAQAENGGRGKLAVLVETVNGRLIVAHGGLEVVIGLLLQEALLQQRAEVVGGGKNKSGGQKERREEGNDFYFHGVMLPDWKQWVVMVL